MSIRFRLTLLYTTILALTLILFGSALYTIQSQETMSSLKRDLRIKGDALAHSILRTAVNPNPGAVPPPPPNDPPVDVPFSSLTGAQAVKDLRGHEIMRILDPQGNLISSPFDGGEALPISADGLAALAQNEVWWEIDTVGAERLLIYNAPVMENNTLVMIVQNAAPLTERDRSLASLRTTLITASLLTTLIAAGIGWFLSGFTLRPIHRITQTARVIGSESDFSRRVEYQGPNDEIGQLATTFNSMLARLQGAYQNVHQALKAQRNFVADVSHELRTPLTTVRGNLALLHRTPPLPPADQADILSDLEEESDRLIRLVNNLLILARADAGYNLSQEPVGLEGLIHEVCRQASLVDEKRIIHAEMDDLTVAADRDALKQVLLILVDNALKHTEGAIWISALRKDDGAEIRVEDEGPGMDEETRAHVFDRFYRGVDQRQTAGFGLGLAIAHSLVEGMKGTIGLESQIDSGTTIWFRLPLSKA